MHMWSPRLGTGGKAEDMEIKRERQAEGSEGRTVESVGIL
jgi:hypothetical protein